jgi:hypothetical protein
VTLGLDETGLLARPPRPLGEALDPDAVERAGGPTRREAREESLEVATRLAVAALGGGRDRADEIRALEADRVEGRPEQPDDDAEERVRRAQELEDGSLDPDELDGEPTWWDEGSDDER